MNINQLLKKIKYKIYDVYCDDHFQYREVFIENYRQISTFTPYKKLNIFSIIANHYKNQCIHIDYNNHILTFQNQYLIKSNLPNLKFIDKIKLHSLKIDFKKSKNNYLITQFDDKFINLMPNINQLDSLKNKYPLINTNILMNFIIRHIY